MKLPPQVCRYVSVYENEADQFVAEFQLSAFDPKVFISEFSIDIASDPQMFSVYPLDESQLKFLLRYLPDGVVFDLKRYANFLEAHSNDDQLAEG